MKTLKLSLTDYFQYKGWVRKLVPAIVAGSVYFFAQILVPFFIFLDNRDLEIGKAFLGDSGNSVYNNVDVGVWTILGILFIFLAYIFYGIVLSLYIYENTKAAIDNRDPKSILEISFIENLNRFGRFVGSGLVILIILLPFYCLFLFLFTVLGLVLITITPVLILLLCPFVMLLLVLVFMFGIIFVQPSLLRMIDEDKVSVVADFGNNLKFGWNNKYIFARVLILLALSLFVLFVIGIINEIFAGIFQVADLQALYIPVFFLYTLATVLFTAYLGVIVQPKFQAELYKRAKANSPIPTE